MDIKITFQNSESSKVMEDYIHEQIQKILEFLKDEREPIFIEFFIRPSHVHAHHQVDMLVKTPNYDLFVKKIGTEIYKVLSEVIDVMYLDLRNEKKKKIDDRKELGREIRKKQ